MTITPPTQLALDESISWEKRIGKSSYWYQGTREEPGQTGSWRLAIVQRPARASKTNPPIVLIQSSPLKPIFTFEQDGHSYPLMIDSIKAGRSGKVLIEGLRKVGDKSAGPLKWTAELIAAEEDGSVRISISARFRRPGRAGSPATVKVRIPIIVYQPIQVTSRLLENQHVAAKAIWSERSQTAIGLYFPGRHGSTVKSENGSLFAEQKDIDIRGKCPLEVVLALGPAGSKNDAVQLLRSEAATTMLLAPPVSQEPESTPMTVSRLAIRTLQDSKSTTTIGKERWYLRVREQYEYGPGYPFFSAEASPVLMRWSRFYLSEIAERTANLTARGVAADFAAIVGEPGAEGNKGAFWDFASGPPDKLKFSTLRGLNHYGIASSARIAFALFEMLAATRDPLFRQSGLNTSHWLLLKQNDGGYYDGPYISASNGKTVLKQEHLDGAFAIRPLIAAYRTTKSEIFIKAAWRIINYIDANLLPAEQAPCLYGIGQSTNCPVALSALLQSLMDVYAESANRDLKKMILNVAGWLSFCEFDNDAHTCLNYDGSYAGTLECADAALRLFTFTKSDRWFTLGHGLLRFALTKQAHNWRVADMSIKLLLSLAALLPNTTVDLPNLRSR